MLKLWLSVTFEPPVMTLVPQFLSFVYQYYVLEVPCAVDMNITSDDVSSNLDIWLRLEP